MKIDIKGWIPVISGLVTTLLLVGMLYGQTTTKLDTLQTQMKNFENQRVIEIEKKDDQIKNTNTTVQDMKLEQAQMKVMLELMLQKEGITIPSNTGRN